MPLSPIDAVAFNPAGLTRFKGFHFDSATTLTDNPTVNGTVSSDVSDIHLTGHLQHGLFLLPASALTYQIDKMVGGFGAISYAGSGSDWRNSELKEFFGEGPPYHSDITTYAGILRLSPTVAYEVLESLSLGASLDINVVQMDLGYGMGLEYNVGFSVGFMFRPVDMVSIGASYTNETGSDVGRVLYYDPDPTDDVRGDFISAEVKSPHSVRAGIAVMPLPALILAFDYKWYNYGLSHEALDWEDVNVFSIGGQYTVKNWLALRLGYTWHNQPVKEHRGWDPTDPAVVYSEYIRTLGTPLSMERNFTVGIGAYIKNVAFHVAYERTFLSESTSTSAGGVLKYKVEFDQNHYSFGFTIHF
jgi:long-subunit fatty acid transport protein